MKADAGAPDAEKQAAAKAHFATAEAHKQAKRYAEALAELDQALALWPDYADAHWLAAWCQIGAQDKPAAAPHFKRVIELQPNTNRAEEAQRALDSIAAQARAPAERGPIAGEVVQYVVIPGAAIYHRPTCRIAKAAPAGSTRECRSAAEARQAGATTSCTLCKPGPLVMFGDTAPGRELPASIQCRGKTQEGRRCHNRTKHPDGFCHVHREQAPAAPR